MTDDAAADDTDTWFVKAGIKKAWMPAGATVLFGEWGQYNDMFSGLCGASAQQPRPNETVCVACIPEYGVIEQRALQGSGQSTEDAVVTGSEVQALGRRRGSGDRLRRHAPVRSLAAS